MFTPTLLVCEQGVSVLVYFICKSAGLKAAYLCHIEHNGTVFLNLRNYEKIFRKIDV